VFVRFLLLGMKETTVAQDLLIDLSRKGGLGAIFMFLTELLLIG